MFLSISSFGQTFSKIISREIMDRVESFLKGSLDLIPSSSPSVKIQIMGGKVCLRCRGCQQTFENKMFVDITQQCFVFIPQVNFPADNLNFHWRWRRWDRIQAIFLYLFYFKDKFKYEFTKALFTLCFSKRHKWKKRRKKWRTSYETDLH